MKIISGGQTGVDQAALDAAKTIGFETGGWIPKGWITQEGPRPDLGKIYNLKEHNSEKYPPRTFANVKESDLTILIFENWNSPGEICTRRALEQYDKPYIPIRILNETFSRSPENLANELYERECKVLNIAGNSERTAVGIQEKTRKYLYEVFSLLKKRLET